MVEPTSAGHPTEYFARRGVAHFDAAERRIDSLVCCGLGTGIGKMEPRRSAMQMRPALRQVQGPPRLPSYAYTCMRCTRR